MFYGEHLLADEASVKCQTCPDRALTEVFTKAGATCGWFCTRCAYDQRKKLRRQEQIARASLRRRP
jgi:hypothetical protein